jgi:hypothetical protein
MSELFLEISFFHFKPRPERLLAAKRPKETPLRLFPLPAIIHFWLKGPAMSPSRASHLLFGRLTFLNSRRFPRERVIYARVAVHPKDWGVYEIAFRGQEAQSFLAAKFQIGDPVGILATNLTVYQNPDLQDPRPKAFRALARNFWDPRDDASLEPSDGASLEPSDDHSLEPHYGASLEPNSLPVDVSQEISETLETVIAEAFQPLLAKPLKTTSASLKNTVNPQRALTSEADDKPEEPFHGHNNHSPDDTLLCLQLNAQRRRAALLN